ncbi:MAG: hypothetical protein J5742_01930 [Alphaproteobacteria bacterium]|nr:hypothetical protein [Alphaproteobacteria bacterium]
MRKHNLELWIFCVAILAICATGVHDLAEESIYKSKHDNFRPIKNATRYEDSLVYNIGDSTLNARKARYDALVKDYNDAFDDVCARYRGIFPMHQKFHKIYVTPKYAKQIEVNNIKQYSKYIDRYERDSLAPVYCDVYKNKVVPMVRNNTQTK